MELRQMIDKISANRTYLDTGAGKLARLWKSTPELVKSAKNIVRQSVPKTTGPKILIIDIETAPMRAYVWKRWKENISLPQTISEWFMLSWSAKWLYSSEVISEVLTPEEVRVESDLRITKSLWLLLDKADIVVAHNGDKFDIPKINSRFIVNGLTPTSNYTQIDTLKVAQRSFGFSSNKLDALAGYFGFDHKIETNFQLWKSCMEGDREALNYMRIYNEQDVKLLEEVYIKMRPWIKPHPNVSLYNDVNTKQCCTCGSKDVELLEGKYYYTSVGAYRVYKCKCGAHSRGRKSVIEKSKNVNTLTSTAK